MKALLMCAFVMASLTTQASTNLVCKEILPQVPYGLITTQKIVTVTLLGAANDIEVSKAIASGEIDTLQVIIDEEIDQVTKVKIQVSEFKDGQISLLKEVTTFALEADVYFWTESLKFHQFAFYVFMDELDQSTLTLINEKTQVEEKFELACDSFEF